MSYSLSFILCAEETTNQSGGDPGPNPFRDTYPYNASYVDASDAVIARYIEDTRTQEVHEATATISSSQLVSDVSSVSSQSQSDQRLNDEMSEIVGAMSSLPAEEILSDLESMEEIHTSMYHFQLETHSLVTKSEPCIQASFQPSSDKLSETKMCSPPPNCKEISGALGKVIYKFSSPGLSPYSHGLIFFVDPTAPSSSPGISMSQALKGDRGCVDMSDSVPDRLPRKSSYIDVVFRAPRYKPQYIRIPIDCRHAKKIRPTYYNLAYAISDGYKEILQREEPHRYPEKLRDGTLLPDVTNVRLLRLLCLYPIDDDRIIWGAEVVLTESLF